MSSSNLYKSKIWRVFFALFAGISLLIPVSGNVSAQEALSVSMAGDLAAEQQHQQNTTLGYYNLLLGPTSWRFSSGLDLVYDDNVKLQPRAEGDFIIRPNLNLREHWPVTVQNSLDFTLGAGFSEYLKYSELSQLYITPGSGFSFDVYVGDFKINLHDRITITEDSYENAGAGGGQTEILANTIGASADWDLNKAVINFGYDHNNYVFLAQRPGSDNAAEDTVFANAGVRVRPELLVGVEAGGGVIDYSPSGSSSTNTDPNLVQWNAGAFGSAQISDHLSIRADVGYSVYSPETTDKAVTKQNSADSSGYYASLSLSHNVSRWLNYTLEAGRVEDLAGYTQLQEYYYARLTPNWNIFRKFSVSTPIRWQQGNWVYSQVVGPGGANQNYDQISLGLTVGRQLTKNISGSISYQYVQESSNTTDLTYTLNNVDLNLSWQF